MFHVLPQSSYVPTAIWESSVATTREVVKLPEDFLQSSLTVPLLGSIKESISALQE